MPLGSWSQPFNHNGPRTTGGNSNHTNPYSPWYSPPSSAPVNSVVPPPGITLYANGWPVNLNAIHMALIPKGPYRGHVIVWDEAPILATDPPQVSSLPPGSYRSYQAYSIVDPTLNLPPTAFRYRNYLLPLDRVTVPDPNQGGIDGEGFFCAGHTWSPFGDLIVVGGTRFDLYQSLLIFKGSALTYAFNPSDAWAAFPGSTSWSPYSDVGYWREGPSLSTPRWYPTATLSYPLPRTNPNPTGQPPRPREVVIVAGGSHMDPAVAGPSLIQSTWNSIESLIIDGPSLNGGPQAIIQDVLNPTAPPGSGYIAAGPGAAGVDIDFLEEYPRLHMLSSGEFFFSGYAPRWARFDPQTLPISWTLASALPYSSNWQNARHDGSSVLFPNVSAGDPDIILRLGGIDTHAYWRGILGTVGTTTTVESIKPTTVAPNWNGEPSMPAQALPFATATGSRCFCNTVLLPDSGVFLFGGKQFPSNIANPPSLPGGTLMYEAFLFRGGAWRSCGYNTILSNREYHATGLLLPDGTVLIAGGEGRNYDYEIYSPDYRTDATLLAQKPTGIDFQDPVPQFNPSLAAFELSYNTSLLISCTPLRTGVGLAKVVLMAPGSVTHHSCMSQRYISLEVGSSSDCKIEFTTPSDAKRAPRGFYMLFLTTNTGAVSDAIWVLLS